MKIRIFVPIFCFFTAGNCFFLCAQPGGSPVFTHFSIREGLPDRTVYDVRQDRDGYMWFATDRGICRFDGYRFWVPPGPEETKGSAFNLKKDNKGRIWFNRIDASLWHFDGDSVRPWRHNGLLAKYKGKFSKPGGYILSENGEEAWISLEQLGILQVSEWGRDTLFFMKGDGGNAIFIFEQRGNVIWGSHNGPPFTNNTCAPVWYYANGQWIKMDLPCGPVALECYSGKMLAEKTFVFYKNLDGFYGVRAGEPIWRVPFISKFFAQFQQTASGDLFFGVFDGEKGVLHYANLDALRQGKFTRYLQGHQVTGVFMDKAGGLWITTHDDGVFYAANLGARVWDTRHGLLHPMVRNLAAGAGRDLYLGLRDGRVQQFDRHKGTWLEFPIQSEINYNTDLAFDPLRKRLWIATDLMYYWQDKAWHRVPIYYKGRPPGVALTKKIAFSKDYRQVFCSHTNLVVFNNQKIPYYEGKTQPTAFQRFLTLHEDRLDRRWASAQSMLYRLTDTGLVSMKHLYPLFGKRGPVCIADFADTLLAFGFRTQGVLLWGPDSQFVHLKPEHGLPEGTLNHLCDDGKGNLWAATTLGLAKIFKNAQGKWAVRAFTTAHGLPDLEVQDIVADSAGFLWVATGQGLCRFKEPDTSPYRLRPFLRQLFVNGQLRYFAERQHFAHGENNLKIHFLTLNFRQFGQIKYRYRLREQDDWNITDNTSVDFPQLAPSTYRFELQSQDEEGYWSDSCAWDFDIRPPWWATWWCRIGAVLLLCAGAYWAYRSRLHRVHAWGALQQQTYTLERAALQAQMNPHFIFNCLNSIQQFIQQNDREQAIHYLGHFARLVRDTLDASVRGKVSLEDELRMLHHYLDLEKLRFKGDLEYHIETHLASDPSDLLFPPLLIQPMVENAVVHGMRDMGRVGRVEILFQETDDELVVRVRDNGQGIAGLGKNTQPGDHKPIATTITGRRLALLQKDGADAAFQRQNILDANGQVLGVEVVLRIGLG